MEEMINQMVEKVGIDRGLADKVAGLIKQNAGDVAQFLKGDASGLTQLLERNGIDKGVIEKVLTFLKDNADKIPGWMPGGGVLQKAKDLVGGLLGSKESK